MCGWLESRSWEKSCMYKSHQPINFDEGNVQDDNKTLLPPKHSSPLSRDATWAGSLSLTACLLGLRWIRKQRKNKAGKCLSKKAFYIIFFCSLVFLVLWKKKISKADTHHHLQLLLGKLFGPVIRTTNSNFYMGSPRCPSCNVISQKVPCALLCIFFSTSANQRKLSYLHGQVFFFPVPLIEDE